jgi:predicted permease
MTWWRRVFSRDRLESQLDAELRDHFDRLVSDLIARGHSPHEAHRLARLEFGGLDQLKEACRDARGTRWVDETMQDVRYGLRGCRKQPAFTAVAVLTLALGIGANLAIFNLVDALLLRPLPVPQASQLLTITRWLNNNSSEHFSYPQIRALADRRELFESLCGIGSGIVYIGPPEALEPLGTAWVTGRYFETLQLTPALGRLLAPADDEPGAAPVAVISHGLWQRRFGGDAGVIGRHVVIEGQQVAIVGVTPALFNGATIGETADVTFAIHARPVFEQEDGGWISADARWLRVLARPARGMPLEQLQARLDVAWQPVLEATTRTRSPEARARALSMTLQLESGETGTSELRRDLRAPLVVAMVLVTLVLLIACVNVANLLLARGAARAREVALRLAIGAGRGRIVRQRLVESVILAVAGTALGVVLAWWASTGLVGLIAARAGGPDGAIVMLDIAPNWRLFAVCAGVVVMTTIAFGLAPALRATSIAPGAIGNSSRVAEAHGRFGKALIVAQVALSLLLIIGAGLFARSLDNLRAIDRGFTAGNVLLANYDPSRLGLGRSELQAFNQSILESVTGLPGVGAASIAAITPLQGGGMSVPGTVNGVSTGLTELYFNVIGPKFFDIVGTPLLMGRDFTHADDAAGPAVAIVNEQFVRQYLGGSAPLGQRVGLPIEPREMQIVGVVKDAVYESLRARPPATVYLPFLQSRGRPMVLVIDADAPVADVASAIRAAVQPRTPAAPMRIRTFASQIDDSLFEERLMRMLSAIVGALALLLAAIGLYGLMSYSIATRTREIGVRLALGARPARVVRMVLASAVRMVALGVIIGLPLALLSSRLLTRLIFGVTSTDPATIVTAVAILVTVGIAAAALPARRAAAVDPVTSMHVE